MRLLREAGREAGAWHDSTQEKEAKRIYAFVEKAHQISLKRRLGTQGSAAMLKRCENPFKRFVALTSLRDSNGRPLAFKDYDPLSSPGTLGRKFPYLRHVLLKRLMLCALATPRPRDFSPGSLSRCTSESGYAPKAEPQAIFETAAIITANAGVEAETKACLRHCCLEPVLLHPFVREIFRAKQLQPQPRVEPQENSIANRPAIEAQPHQVGM